MLSYQPAPVTAAHAPHVTRGTIGFAGRPSSGALTPQHRLQGVSQHHASVRSLTPPRRDVSPAPCHMPAAPPPITKCGINSNSLAVSRTATPQRVRGYNQSPMPTMDAAGAGRSPTPTATPGITPGRADSGSHTPTMPMKTQSHEPALERSSRTLSASTVALNYQQQPLQRTGSHSQLQQLSQQALQHQQQQELSALLQTLPPAPVSPQPQQQQPFQPQQELPPAPQQVEQPQHQQHHSWSGHAVRPQSLPQMARVPADAPRINFESHVPQGSVISNDPVPSGVSTPSSMPCPPISKEQAMFREELLLLNDESSRITRELRQVKAEMSLLRRENDTMHREKNEWEVAQNKLAQENSQLWEQLQEQRKHIGELTKTLKSMQDQLATQSHPKQPGAALAQVPKAPLDANRQIHDEVFACQQKSNEVMQLRRELASAQTHSMSAEKAWTEERERLQTELHQAQHAQVASHKAQVVRQGTPSPAVGTIPVDAQSEVTTTQMATKLPLEQAASSLPSTAPSSLPPTCRQLGASPLPSTAPSSSPSSAPSSWPATIPGPSPSIAPRPQATSTMAPVEQSAPQGAKLPPPVSRDFAPPPSPLSAPALGGAGAMPDPARLLEDMKKRVAKKVETIATPPSGALSMKGQAPVSQSKEGELTRRLLELKAQMNAVEQQGETLRAATKTVEDEYRNFSSQSTLPPASSGRPSLPG